MKKAHFSRAAFTFCVMTLPLLAAAPWSGQNASPETRRATFLKLIDRPRAQLAPEAQELGVTDGLAQTRFTYAADAEQRAPGILVKQAKSVGRRPVVIALHGTGGNKEGQLALLKELAGLGFIGV